MTRSKNSKQGTYQRIKGCSCNRCSNHSKRITQRKWDWKKFYDSPYFTTQVQSSGMYCYNSNMVSPTQNGWYYDFIQDTLLKAKKDYKDALGNWCLNKAYRKQRKKENKRI